jgi:diguanylate cyclase (GGDEF)-like protein
MVRTTPIHDEHGAITGAVEIFSDNSTMDGMRRHVRHLEQTNQMDELTGVGNRRFIEKRIRLALKEFNSTGRKYGILFVDLDNFKDVNDRWGHETGDRILRLVASTLHRNIRSEDALGRWGGEEFVVLLADVDRFSIQIVAEKLRSLVEQTRSRQSSESVATSVSIGCTLLHPKDTLVSVVDRGDRNMYRSKHLGKNRVYLDEEDTE